MVDVHLSVTVIIWPQLSYRRNARLAFYVNLIFVAAKSAKLPTRSRENVLGSGTCVGAYVRSSSTKDPPAGSPVTTILEMPPAKLSCSSSFGLLPGSPERAKLFEYCDVIVAIILLARSYAVRVIGTR